jgi:CRISPR-associated protein Csm1
MIEPYKQKLRSAFESQTADPPISGMYILKGDVSGIQEFIFNIQSEGAARMLKARSFFIQVVVKLCVEKIRRTFSDFKTDIIGDSGGSFYITFNGEPNHTELKDLTTWINQELIVYDLFISITTQVLNDWSKTMELLKQAEEIQKFQRFSHWPDAFRPTMVEKNDTAASTWKEFAKQLSLSKGYSIKETSGYSGIQPDAVVLWNLKLKLEKENPVLPFNDPESSLMNSLPVWREGNPYFKRNLEGKNDEEVELQKNKGNDYETPKEGDIIDFDHLAIQAKARTGTYNLGILKLDVDNLGKMFRDDFNTEQKYKDASDAFSYFFGKHMKDLWETKTFKGVDGNEHHYHDNILIIYSGGDDCFLLGGWDAVLEFAQMFREEFKDFCSGIQDETKRPTFSAAILLLQTSTPVIQIGHLAEDELDKAKQFSSIKNEVSLFGEIFTWDEFDKMKKLTAVLSDLIKGADGKPKESKALLQKIRLSARGYDALMKNVTMKKQVNFQRVWNLTWFILRNVNKDNKKRVESEIVSNYHDAVLEALNTKKYSKALIFPAAARWTELLTRKIKEDE